MKSKKLLQQQSKLVDLSFDLSVLMAAERKGEPFHPDYMKNKNAFRKLIRSENKTLANMKKYFKEFAERAMYSINWDAYNTQARKASVIDDMIQIDWNREQLLIKVFLTDALMDAIVAGGESIEDETSIDIGWGPSSPPALDFLSQYTLKLAGQLSDTSYDRIKGALRLSITNGEDIYGAINRIAGVLDDASRAEVIARTESVRAFAEGRLAVAREIGADRKKWSSTLKACSICDPLNNDVVALDKLFDGKYMSPPAHPNCRCLVRILMPNERG